MARIVIDAGHGGTDWGATRDGRMEKADVLALAIAIGRELSRRGHSVIYTRQTDIFIPLQERARISNNQNADLFVSVHRNAAENSAGNGFEIFVSPSASARARACATNVLNRVNSLGVFANRGLKTGNFVVLNTTNAPAMLVEYGFISNAADNSRFDQNFSRLAIATADGADDCISGVSPPVTPPPPPPSGGLSATVTTAGGNLNVRNAPNTTAPIIGSLANGTRINVLQEQNGWYRINFQGQSGWISSGFVSILPQTGRVSTTGGNLNMRSAPSTTASILASIPNGTQIPILDMVGSFYQTTWSGQSGWVSSGFVTV